MVRRPDCPLGEPARDLPTRALALATALRPLACAAGLPLALLVLFIVMVAQLPFRVERLMATLTIVRFCLTALFLVHCLYVSFLIFRRPG